MLEKAKRASIENMGTSENLNHCVTIVSIFNVKSIRSGDVVLCLIIVFNNLPTVFVLGVFVDLTHQIQSSTRQALATTVAFCRKMRSLEAAVPIWFQIPPPPRQSTVFASGGRCRRVHKFLSFDAKVVVSPHARGPPVFMIRDESAHDAASRGREKCPR